MLRPLTHENGALSSLRMLASRFPFALALYRHFQGYYLKILLAVSPLAWTKLRFRKVFGREINLSNPTTYSEKLVWLMFYWKHPLKTRCGDKYAVRSYIEECGCGDVLIPLLGVYENTDEIDFDKLPKRFVLKCTHGCGYNVICKDKDVLNITETKRVLDRWLREDYSKIAGEPHYHGMDAKIICEPFLDDLAGELPIDYKLYCIGGRVYCANYVKGRTIGGHSIIETMYDRDWKPQPYLKESIVAENIVPPPLGYRRMVDVAEILAKPFPFVRVDFYSIKGKAVFGEMTFTPGGSISASWTNEAQRRMGELLKLPEPIL